MANVQSLENHEVSEALTPSTLLEQLHEDLVSEMCFPSRSYLRSPDRSEAEEAVAWFSNYTGDLTSDQSAALAVYTDVPLHQSEPLSETREETLSDLNAACLLDTELFQLSDQTRDIKPLSEFHSGRQEAKHQHIHSVPTFPSIRDPCPPVFPFSHHPCVMFHRAPALDTTRGHTSIPSQHLPRFISIPQPNDTASQQCINFHTCQVHQPIPTYIFTHSHVNLRFPSHLSVLNPNPAVHQLLNAERPSETLDCTFSRNRSWHTRKTPRDVHENFRVWQRFCETAKGFYSGSPDVEALACFFLYEMGSLTVHHSRPQIIEAVNAAARKWNKKPAAQREIYYTSASMFIQLQEEERRVVQHRFKPRGHVSQHSSGKERSAVLSGYSEVMSALEVKDRSEVNAVNKNACQVSSTFQPSTPTTSNVPGRERVFKRMRRAAVRRMRRFTNSTKTRQTGNEIIRNKRQNEPQMRQNRKLKRQVTRDRRDQRRLSGTTNKLHEAKY